MSEATDLVAGHAGRALALICLADLLDDAGLVDDALRSGRRLLDLAVRRTRGGWSWPTPHESRPHLHLTGFAHGAAGIGYALAELYGVTGDATYGHAALRAFDYERTWFSAADGNWPDLRRTNRRAAAEKPVFGQAWCHGAPGIALSRMRAYDILGESVLLREAQAALRTTMHAVRRAVAAGPTDYSLCHGVLGQIEVIWEGRLHVPGGGAETERLFQNVARCAAAFARGQKPWPCGSLTGEETPGLMLGLAGIGYQHLRMVRPAEVGSLLLPMVSTPRRRSAAGAS
jgi:lantibiotic modifying enzyme